MTNKYQDRFGHPAERARGKVRPYMATWIQDFIRQSPFCVVATSNAAGDCDASPKGGKPGFVKVLNDKQLFIPDVAGNKLFHGYQNIESNPKCFKDCCSMWRRRTATVRALCGLPIYGIPIRSSGTSPNRLYGPKSRESDTTLERKLERNASSA